MVNTLSSIMTNVLSDPAVVNDIRASGGRVRFKRGIYTAPCPYVLLRRSNALSVIPPWGGGPVLTDVLVSVRGANVPRREVRAQTRRLDPARPG